MLLGLTEGVVYPAVMILLSEWVPWTERTRAVGLVFSGNAIGTRFDALCIRCLCVIPLLSSYVSVSTVVAPLLIEGLGWRSIFYVYSSVGFFWCADEYSSSVPLLSLFMQVRGLEVRGKR